MISLQRCGGTLFLFGLLIPRSLAQTTNGTIAQTTNGTIAQTTNGTTVLSLTAATDVLPWENVAANDALSSSVATLEEEQPASTPAPTLASTTGAPAPAATVAPTNNNSTTSTNSTSSSISSSSSSSSSSSEGEVTTWSGIWVTGLVSILQGLVFYAFFLYQRRGKHGDLYEPRQHNRQHRSPSPDLEEPWWKAALAVPPEELLRCVGLDSFMFLRFLRLGAYLCSVGTVMAIVLIPIYATGENTGNDTKAFNQWTLARVESGGGWRLWISLIAWYIFVAVTLHALYQEWVLYRSNRSQFLAKGDEDMPPEYRYAVRVDKIPPQYRNDPALQSYFDRLFPRKVLQATMFWETPVLNQLIKERQEVITKMEQVDVAIHTKPEEPRPTLKVNKESGKADLLSSVTSSATGAEMVEVDAREHYTSELQRLNDKIDEERQKFWGTKNEADASTDVDGDVNKGEDESPAEEPKEVASTALMESDGNMVDQPVEATGEKRGSARLSNAFKDSAKMANALKESMINLNSKENRVTSTAHVTFTSLRAKQAAIQCELTGNPDLMVVVPAPDPNGVLWNNVGVPLTQQTILQHQAAALFTAGILFWSVPVFFVQAIANLNGILAALNLPQADPTSGWYGLVSGLLPVIFLAIFMAVLFLAIVAVATHFVRYKSMAEVDAYTLYWHQLFQFANLWLILIGGSAFDQMDKLLEDPMSVIDVIAASMPGSSVFFVNMMLVGSFGFFGLELSCLPACGAKLVTKLIKPEEQLTQRQLDDLKTPPFIIWGQVVPKVVFIFLVILVYMPIVPIMEVFGVIYFSGYYLVFKHQCLHVYAQEFEGGGEATWQRLFPFLMACLYMGELIFIAYMGIKKAPTQSLLGFIPLIVTILFHRHLGRTIINPLQNLSLEMAAQVDIDDGELEENAGNDDSTPLYGMPALKSGEEEERGPLPYREGAVLPQNDEEAGKDTAKEPEQTQESGKASEQAKTEEGPLPYEAVSQEDEKAGKDNGAGKPEQTHEESGEAPKQAKAEENPLPYEAVPQEGEEARKDRATEEPEQRQNESGEEQVEAEEGEEIGLSTYEAVPQDDSEEAGKDTRALDPEQTHKETLDASGKAEC